MKSLRTTLAPMLLVVALLVGCGSSGTPVSVAQAFYEEMAAGNIEAAKLLSTPETAELLDYIAATHCTEMFEQIAVGGASCVRIEEGKALVSFVEGGGFGTVPLVERDGGWKVDFAMMMKAHTRPDPVRLTL